MARSRSPGRRSWSVEEGADAVWRGYTTEEDRELTNLHYDQPAEFFTTITGGDWGVYSCNLWDGATSVTESQERKLDLLAQLMDLQPGQRVLDVGCGWGGPLVYLAKRYGIRGVGLTLSSTQKQYADRRIHEHDVDVEVYECHWRDFLDTEPFDAVFTDEVIVHFNDLLGYFEKVKALLKPGGRMLNKELHFVNSRFMQLTRAMIFLNEIFGQTGNYRMLHDELALLDQAGFILERIHQLAVSDYAKTANGWLANMQRHRTELEALVGPEHFRRFRTYLRIVRQMHGSSRPPMALEVVVATSPV